MTENLCSTKKQDIRRGLIAVFIFLALVLAITAGLFCINAFGAEATESLQIQEKGTSTNEATQNLLQDENTSSVLSTIDNLPLKKGSSYVQAANAQEPWLNTTTNVTYATLNDAVSAATSGDTIKMTDMTTITSTVTIDKKITIDLGGQKTSGGGDWNYVKSCVSSTSETAERFMQAVQMRPSP